MSVSHPSAASPVDDGAALAFTARLALSLGLDADAASALAAGDPFAPAGSPVPMRLHLGHVDDALVARLEVILPLAGEDLVGPDVGRMLRLQAAMLAEGTWWLSINADGLLHLSSVPWFDTPEAVQEAMDAAIVAAPSIARAIVVGEQAS